MKKLVNSTETMADDMIDGFVAAFPEIVTRGAHPRVVRRTNPKSPDDKVALLIGNGSGHEPIAMARLVMRLGRSRRVRIVDQQDLVEVDHRIRQHDPPLDGADLEVERPDGVGGRVRRGERATSRTQLAVPDFARIVLDPAGLAKMLRKFVLVARDEFAIAVEEDGARGRRPLIQR